MASLQFAVVILVLEHVHFGLFCPGAELPCQRLHWQRTPGTVSPGRAAADTAVLLECIHFGSVFVTVCQLRPNMLHADNGKPGLYQVTSHIFCRAA